MDPFGVSEIQPVQPTAANDDLAPPAEMARKLEPIQANYHLPWPALLDLGAGIRPAAYAEYTVNEAADRVSIRIIDPITGSVIREIPREEVLEFAEAEAVYVDLGRRRVR